MKRYKCSCRWSVDIIYPTILVDAQVALDAIDHTDEGHTVFQFETINSKGDVRRIQIMSSSYYSRVRGSKDAAKSLHYFHHKHKEAPKRAAMVSRQKVYKDMIEGGVDEDTAREIVGGEI